MCACWDGWDLLSLCWDGDFQKKLSSRQKRKSEIAERESFKSGVSLVERRSHLFGKESREEGIWGVSTSGLKPE